MELQSLAPNHAIISKQIITKLFCPIIYSLSSEGLYLKWKQNQVSIFSTKCTLINFSNQICQREDVSLYTKLHSSSFICRLKMEGRGRNFHHLSHFKAVSSIFSNSNYVIPPIMLKYDLFFAWAVTQTSVKIHSQQPMFFSGWKAFRIHMPTLPFLSIHCCPISKILFPQISSCTLLTFPPFPSSLLMAHLGIHA